MGQVLRGYLEDDHAMWIRIPDRKQIAYLLSTTQIYCVACILARRPIFSSGSPNTLAKGVTLSNCLECLICWMQNHRWSCCIMNWIIISTDACDKMKALCTAARQNVWVPGGGRGVCYRQILQTATHLLIVGGFAPGGGIGPVSYTHLTLPTIYSV